MADPQEMALETRGVKKRKLADDSAGHDGRLPQAASKRAQKAFFKNATNWNLEEGYESRARKKNKKEKENTRLPIKTADGRLEVLQSLDDDKPSAESDTEWLEGREDEAESGPDEAGQQDDQPQVSDAQKILAAQEELAKIATAVNENPEEHAGAFRALAQIARSTIPAIQMLALMTQMTVYKDVIPGYRIRALSEDASKEKLSKEVRELRQYEQSLVAGYQNYVKELARCAKLSSNGSSQAQQVSSVAVTCACTLVTAVPHFNFRGDLLRILVNKLSRRAVDEDADKCRQALETLFRDDEEGRPSLEAVSLLAKMMRARDFQVDERVLNLFLTLRLLSEFSGKASPDAVVNPSGASSRTKKSKREFRTKRQRKAVKEQRELDKDMMQADAMVSHEERDRMQSETLKLVFATYFRILKAHVPHLMGAVLEGLAKYAHLINQDFFGDLLEALKDLIRHSEEAAQATVPGGDDDTDEDEEDSSGRDLTREALLCTVTAFALLAGQDAHNSRNDLHLDLSFFITHLYRSLLDVSLQPGLEKTRAASMDTPTATKINVHTATVLLLRSLTAILLPPYNIRSVSPLRLASFTKQLMTVALQLPEKSCQGVLALLVDVARTHGKKVASLWDTEERKGDGRFHAASDSIELSNPFAATVWEGELLRKHFSPKVREGVKLLEKGLAG